MVDQSAVPPYIWTRVRPWTAMAEMPTCSSILLSSTALILPLSQPRRILTVTGTGEDLTTASARRAAFSGSFMRAAPSPLETTLPTGQPMLMSRRSAKKSPGTGARSPGPSSEMAFIRKKQLSVTEKGDRHAHRRWPGSLFIESCRWEANPTMKTEGPGSCGGDSTTSSVWALPGPSATS